MHVGVIGLGLIGGSFAKAAARAGHMVSVWNRTGKTSEKALLDGTASSILDDELMSENGRPRFFFISLPPAAVADWIEAHQRYFEQDTVVVDATGVKRTVCKDLEKYAFSTKWVFVGGHPMAGKEVSGYANSCADLFDGASMILTPYPTCSRKTVEMLYSLFKGIGFKRIVTTFPDVHDKMIALTSQLAHVVSAAYVKDPSAVEHIGYSAGSFRDMTRVAGVDPEVWSDLFLANSDFLSTTIDAMISRLGEFSEAIKTADREKLVSLLERSREAKNGILAADAAEENDNIILK